MNGVLKGFIKAFLILAIIVSIWYVVSYKIWQNRGFDDNLDLSKYFEEEKKYYEEVIDNKEDIAKSLYSKINFKMVEENFGTNFFEEYYGKDSTNLKNFTDEFIVYLAIINLQKDLFMTECNQTQVLSSEKVDDKIKEIFGKNVEYENVSYSNSDGSFIIEYLAESNSYKVTNTKCSGIGFKKNYIETEFFESKVVNNDIIVTEIVYYTSYSLKSDGSYVLNFHYGLDENSQVIYNSSMGNDIDKNKFMKYNYTFIEGSNDNYYLSKIEKVN